jgi:hypothetical protein
MHSPVESDTRREPPLSRSTAFADVFVITFATASHAHSSYRGSRLWPRSTLSPPGRVAARRSPSHAMTPPPKITKRRGASFAAVASLLLHGRAALRPGIGRIAARVPVHTATACRAVSSLVVPSFASTLTWRSRVRRPCPAQDRCQHCEASPLGRNHASHW